MGRFSRINLGANESPLGWLPKDALNYLKHVEGGQSIRSIARNQGCHASTIMRQVRRIERRRDDFLIDELLKALGCAAKFAAAGSPKQEAIAMTLQGELAQNLDTSTIEGEARRVLRRMAESGALLAVARDIEKAVVVREMPDGRTIRTSVVDRSVAQAMAMKDWIACKSEGRISRYRLTQAGRATLKRLLATDPDAHHGFAEAPTGFEGQPYETNNQDGTEDNNKMPRRVRYGVAESPVATLARRKSKGGKPFLDSDLVVAAERLREDFEMAQMGPRVAQNWENFLTGKTNKVPGGTSLGDGPMAARERVRQALNDLGPGLADVVLRCCCFLEGMETTERQMGWSARSGKIVLRIALQRLKRHYDECGSERLIG